MGKSRRWYDKDPFLQEAVELLSISPDETKDQAAEFILGFQEQIAKEVIEKIYENVSQYHATGNRWYDKDPVMLKAIELLRVSPPYIQRLAAKKLLAALEQGNMKSLKENLMSRV